MEIKNIFENIPQKLEEELFETLAQKGKFKIERIISEGQTTPENQWYDQDEDEFVLLLQGKAELLFEDGEKVKMQKGDYVIIPAHKKHRVVFTSKDEKCVWLTVFY